jgi:hypothetical protein
MAIQAMALGVNNPEINAVSALAAGQQARQSFDMNNVQIAKAGLETIGSIALGAMGGKIDGQADPALFNEGLDYLAQQGVNVDQFRDRADLAPVIARSSMTALQQMQMAQDEKSYQLALDNFELEVMKAAQGPKPTAEMQNFTLAQTDPAFAAHLAAKDAPNPPADVAAYDAYAADEKAAGREPLGRLEYQQALKGQGFSVTTADGTTVQMGGASPKLTEAQGKDIGFYTRGAQANQGLSGIEGELTNFVQQNANVLPLGLGNYARTPEFRQAKVEADNFLTALLRKDTGAAITDNEFELYGPMFLPVPGDDPATIALKRQKRATALLALRSGLGTAEIIAATNEQTLGMPTPNAEAIGGATPSATAAPAGEPARPTSDAEYDAIPSGGLFIDPDDGQTYEKP